MSVNSYAELRYHIGHKIECACYGLEGSDPNNIAIECVDCNVVLLDFDNPEDGDPNE